MSDLPSAVGIEAVECLFAGGRSVTVRVTGRWRRRRPELRGQAMLVVETPSGRQRFLAMPEPPSLFGAAPGTWRMSFAVPAALAPQLPGRTFLQLGAVMVPIPIGEVDLSVPEAAKPDEETPSPAEGPSVEPPARGAAEAGGAWDTPESELLEARRLRSSELAAESARRRAAEAEAAAAELVAHIEGLEKDLERAQAESDRLGAVIAEGERRLRVSEQTVHSERALRTEAEQQLRAESRAAEHERRVLRERMSDLEDELGRMRRAVDEARHLAAAAEAARADAERRHGERAPPAPVETPPPAPPPVETPPPVVVETPPPSVDAARAERIAAELALARATRRVTRAPAPPLPAPPAVDQTALGHEWAMIERRAERRDPRLEHELAEARRELAEARRELGDVRRELDGARREVEEQRRRSARAYEAIALVRGELAQIRATAFQTTPAEAQPAPAAPQPPPGPVQADRLSAALARLRETTPPSAPASSAEPTPEPSPETPATPATPATPTRPWLGKAFRTLTDRDASSAGRLLLALLPAQRAADPRPVAYDLVLGDVASARVTVSSAGEQIDLGDTPRPMTEVDFQLVGDLASIARLLAAGPMRRRLARLPIQHRIARIRGDRGRLASLEALVSAPLTLAQLRAAGVRLDPVLALTVTALMIEPEWTAGERFTIAHQEAAETSPDAYLHVRAGNAPLAAAEPPHGPVATVIRCAADDLLAVLAGEQVAGVTISGEERPPALMRQWLDRAQSG